MINPYSRIARHYSVTLTFSPKGKMKRAIEEHDPLGDWNRRALSINKRAFRKGAKQFITGMELFGRVLLYNGKCWICGAHWENIDHVKPLSLGGENIPCNLRPICKNCNNKKYNHWYGPLSPAEYAARILARESCVSRAERIKSERAKARREGKVCKRATHVGGSIAHPVDLWILDEIRAYYKAYGVSPRVTWVYDITKGRDGKGYGRPRARRAIQIATGELLSKKRSRTAKPKRVKTSMPNLLEKKVIEPKRPVGGSLPDSIPQHILNAISNYISERGQVPLPQWARQLAKETTGKEYRYEKAKRAIRLAQCTEQAG